MEKEGCGIFDRHTELNREELHVVKYGQRECSRQAVGHARGKHRDQQTSGWTLAYLKEINGKKKFERQSGAKGRKSYVNFKSWNFTI